MGKRDGFGPHWFAVQWTATKFSQSLRYCFSLTRWFWPCSNNSKDILSSSLGCIPFFSFFLQPEAVVCVSQMKHLTSLSGVFYFSHCLRKPSVKCAPGATVCSLTPVLWTSCGARCTQMAPKNLREHRSPRHRFMQPLEECCYISHIRFFNFNNLFELLIN